MKKPSKVVLRTGIALILIAFNMHLSAQENTPKDSLWKSMNLTEFVVTAHFMPTSVQDADYQVEVIKGASSVLYGSSALSGVINIRTKFPRLEPKTKVIINSIISPLF